MNWTQEQKEAITLRDSNILVSAAAGSGKTAVLVERIKSLLIEEKVPVDEILVVTFTNAAAGEMKEKIVGAISKAITEADVRGREGVDEARFLRDQLASIHKASISTFHAFALNLIKRYFHLIGIEPNFKICDEARQWILKGKAMEELFSRKYREEDQSFLRFLNGYAGSRSDGAVKEMILNTHEFIRSLPQPFSWLKEQVDNLLMEEVDFVESNVYRSLMKQINREMSHAIFKAKKVVDLLSVAGLSQLGKKAEDDLLMLRETSCAFEKSFDFGVEAINSVEFSRFSATKDEKAQYEIIKGKISFLRGEAKDAIKRIKLKYCWGTLNQQLQEMRMTQESAETLCNLTEEFDKEYMKQKNSKGLVDFSDVEHYALKILNLPMAAEECKRKYRYIFIDEYQDSNLVQEALIGKICRESNLFMVGDVKQSIYKFRLAEPQIFIDRYEAYKNSQPFAPNKKLDLNRNFRSKGTIIETINWIFRCIMNLSTAGIAYDEDAALYQGLSYPQGMERPVSLHIVESKDKNEHSESGDQLMDEIKEMKKIEIEAAAAAKILSQNLGKPFYDTKRQIVRPLQKKDMVILLRSASGAGQAYADALSQAGIPAYLDVGDDFFDTLEISVFLNLLKIIDNRKQDIPLLSVLRSPIFNFSLQDLAEIRVVKKEGSFEEAFALCAKGEDDLAEKCKKALGEVGLWREWKAYYPLEELLWKLLMETGYYHYIGAVPGGILRQANLRMLVEKASAYRKGQDRGLFGFINYVETLKRLKVATPQVKMCSESDDVVRIMTIHKSKGLEFPFVLIGNLNRRFNRDKKSKGVSLHKDLGFALPRVDKERRFFRPTIIKNIIDTEKEGENLAEEIRVLYVAMTRAMDRMVLLGTLSDFDSEWEGAEYKDPGDGRGNSYMDFLLPSLKGKEGLTIKRHDIVELSEWMEGKKDKDKVVLKALEEGFPIFDNEGLDEINGRLQWKYPHMDAVETKSKFSVTRLIEEYNKERSKVFHRNRGTLSVPGFTNVKTKLTGAEKGTILHRIMEHIPFTDHAKKVSAIEEFVNDLVKGEILTETEARAVDLTLIRNFFLSDLGRRAIESDEVYREVSFNLKMERKGEPILVQGTIDCYFKGREDEYVLLDYKSNFIIDKVEAIENLVEIYEPQLNIYREALERIQNIRVSEMYIYLFSLGRAIRI